MDQNPPIAASETPLASEDFYFDGPNVVFTAAYLLKRGSCCTSGCRHCPYGFAKAGAQQELKDVEPPAAIANTAKLRINPIENQRE
jgi:hypothetical protein